MLGRIGVVAPQSPARETGGAERFFHGLVDALRREGHSAELVPLLVDESTFETIEESYLRAYDLDVTRFDTVISTKAPTYAVRHPKHVCYLVHTMRVFYDMFDEAFPLATHEQRRQRRMVLDLDSACLDSARVRRIFAIGYEVRERLQRFNAREAEVLHPALGVDNFSPGPYGDYLFLPGRLHRWKRVDLVIEAFRHVRTPLRLLIAGTGEAEAHLRESANGDPRIVFLGRIDDEALRSHYMNCLGVPFVPLREDYGYVTLEAFASAKPVITCIDSGEPTHFVRDGETGFVCPADPRVLAARFDALFEDRTLAGRMGEAGRRRTECVQWAHVIATLAGAVPT